MVKNDKQLAMKTVNFSWVPEVAKSRFESQMEWWYMELADKGSKEIPHIRDGMFFEHEGTRRVLLDIYKDIFEYHYAAGAKGQKFKPNQFPVNLFNHRESTYLWENSQLYFEKHESQIELRFFEDMKRYLMHNKMFFQESYSFDKRFHRPTFQNIPFGEVW